MQNEYQHLERRQLNTFTMRAHRFLDSSLNVGVDDRSSKLVVLNCNPQSVLAHADDIATDLVLQRCDYLALSETWMRGTEQPMPITDFECVCRRNNNKSEQASVNQRCHPPLRAESLYINNYHPEHPLVERLK